jgi:hypothetical protein
MAAKIDSAHWGSPLWGLILKTKRVRSSSPQVVCGASAGPKAGKRDLRNQTQQSLTASRDKSANVTAAYLPNRTRTAKVHSFWK